jgi:hypothetical protein
VTVAHLAGVPFEEWLTVLLASGVGLALTPRTAVARRSFARRRRTARARLS